MLNLDKSVIINNRLFWTWLNYCCMMDFYATMAWTVCNQLRKLLKYSTCQTGSNLNSKLSRLSHTVNQVRLFYRFNFNRTVLTGLIFLLNFRRPPFANYLPKEHEWRDSCNSAQGDKNLHNQQRTIYQVEKQWQKRIRNNGQSEQDSKFKRMGIVLR